eukprot:2924929-Rhodomonas_salina.2
MIAATSSARKAEAPKSTAHAGCGAVSSQLGGTRGDPVSVTGPHFQRLPSRSHWHYGSLGEKDPRLLIQLDDFPRVRGSPYQVTPSRSSLAPSHIMQCAAPEPERNVW